MTTSAVPSPLTRTLAEIKEIVIAVTHAKIFPAEISDTVNLFDNCGLDSSSVVDLVLALEDKYKITIAVDQLEVGLFQNLSSLANYIETLKAPNHETDVAGQ
jgi:acyl carrier protein